MSSSTHYTVATLVPLYTVIGSKFRLCTLIGTLPYCKATTSLATRIEGFLDIWFSTSHLPLQPLQMLPTISISLIHSCNTTGLFNCHFSIKQLLVYLHDVNLMVCSYHLPYPRSKLNSKKSMPKILMM